jgi:hypothetical protein
MKKIYQAPTLKWVEAETEEMIAGSPVENGFSLKTENTTNETSGNLSRRGRSIWDDEEEY